MNGMTKPPETISVFHAEVAGILKSSTIHGLSHVSSASSRYSKLFWLVLVLAGIGGFTANLVFIVERYLSKPVLTTYVPEYEPFLWPDITFCNPSAPISFRVYPHLKDKWDALLNAAKKYDNLRFHEDELPGLIFALSSLNPHEYHLDDVKQMIAYQPSADRGKLKIDKSIEFQDALQHLPELQRGFYNRLMFSRYPMPCHTFQVNRYESMPGYENLTSEVRQLVFAINADFESYRFYNSDYIYRGVFMHLTLSNHLASGDGYLILPGFNNYIKIKMTRTKYFKEKRNCRDKHFTVELYNAMFNSTRVYQGNHVDCKHYLSQKMYLTKCNCYNPFLPIYKTDQVPPRLCLNMTFFNDTEIRRNFYCLQDTFVHYNATSEFEERVARECGQYKRAPCEHPSYNNDFKSDMWIEVWSGETNKRRQEFLYSAAGLLVNASRSKAVEELRRNVAYVILQRDSAHGDLVKEEPEYPLSEVISDIGGLMGLWMGLSVVGLFELVEILHLLIRYPCISEDERRRKQREEERRNICYQEISLDNKNFRPYNGILDFDNTRRGRTSRTIVC